MAASVAIRSSNQARGSGSCASSRRGADIVGGTAGMVGVPSDSDSRDGPSSSSDRVVLTKKQGVDLPLSSVGPPRFRPEIPQDRQDVSPDTRVGLLAERAAELVKRVDLVGGRQLGAFDLTAQRQQIAVRDRRRLRKRVG
jgi:hypothetical protein